jgi:hypothetical protein
MHLGGCRGIFTPLKSSQEPTQPLPSFLLKIRPKYGFFTTWEFFCGKTTFFAFSRPQVVRRRPWNHFLLSLPTTLSRFYWNRWLKGLLRHIWCPMTHDNEICDINYNCDTYDWYTMWHSRPESYKPLQKQNYDNLGYLTDVTLCITVTPKVLEFIGPLNDGRRHGI